MTDPGAPDELREAAQRGAGEVTASVIVNAPAERVFAALLAWERQSEWIPFTTVRVVEGDGGEGSLVEAVTTLGPAVLRDRMRVVRVDAPYEIGVVHCGTLLRGPGCCAAPSWPADAARWSGTSGSTCRAVRPAGWPGRCSGRAPSSV